MTCGTSSLTGNFLFPTLASKRKDAAIFALYEGWIESTWELPKERRRKNQRGIKPVKLCGAIVRAASGIYLEIIAFVSESLQRYSITYFLLLQT